MVRGGVLDLGPSHCDLVYLKQLWGSTEVGDDRDVVNPLVWSRVKVQQSVEAAWQLGPA